MKILIVDDNPRHRRAGVKQLQALGHEVVAMSSYGEAREKAQEEKFDCALIDLFMPAEEMTLGPEARKEFLGKEIGVGFPMVLELTSLGIGNVSVITDTNHHAHPMSAVVDWFDGKTLVVNGAKVLIMHAWLNDDGTKNWGKALEELLTQK